MQKYFAATWCLSSSQKPPWHLNQNMLSLGIIVTVVWNMKKKNCQKRRSHSHLNQVASIEPLIVVLKKLFHSVLSYIQKWWPQCFRIFNDQIALKKRFLKPLFWLNWNFADVIFSYHRFVCRTSWAEGSMESLQKQHELYNTKKCIWIYKR